MEPSRVRMIYILEVFIMKRTFWIVAHITCGVASIAILAYMLAKRYAEKERTKGYQAGVEAGRLMEALHVTTKIMDNMVNKETKETEETNKNDD